MKRLEALLDYHFQDPEILRLAFVHPSTQQKNNQRLEFLGDAVLQFCISDLLYHRYPEWQEGPLTARRAALVCEKTLSVLARSLCLGEYLLLSHGEDLNGGRENDSVLADAMEAVLAAVFEDGGIDAAKSVIFHLFEHEENMVLAVTRNTKAELQEWLQQQGKPVPVYEITGQEGPVHRPVFHARVMAEGQELATGSGHSKQEAEKAAAKAALQILKFQGDR